MRRTAFALAVALFAASSTGASATTLSIGTDKLTYQVGETVTVTVTGDAGEEPPGEPVRAYAIFGRLDYSGALVDNGTRTQTKLVGDYSGPLAWQTGALSQGDDGTNAFSDAFNQANLYGDSANNLPAAFSTVTLAATAVGVVGLDWHTAFDPFQLTFFGLTDAPGTSFTIVPEPATAALIAVGLCAIAFASGTRR
jgi:hypothetical protein